MNLEETKGFQIRVGVALGLVNVWSVGLINSVYSETRYHSSHGTQYLRDSVFVSYSNPFALLAGALVFAFFYKLSRLVRLNEEGQKETKLDTITIVITLAMMLLNLALMQGIIVY